MKRVIAITLLVVLTIAMATTADALPTADDFNPVWDLSPEEFTPEALLASGFKSIIEGSKGFRESTYGVYFLLEVQISGYFWDVVFQGDSVEYAGMAYAVYADGTIVNGVVERFADGERVTIVLPPEKKGMLVAAAISYRYVRGKEESKIYKMGNMCRYSEQTRVYDGFSDSPYAPAPTPRTATGSVTEIFYTDAYGMHRITQNPLLRGNKPSVWAVSEVNAAIEEGLVSAQLQSLYWQAITRAEFCALSVSLYEKYTGKEITECKEFIDTDDINVEKAAAIGIVEGVGNSRFDPNNVLSREQAAIILARLADAIGEPMQSCEATFSDNSDVSFWALNAVGQMQAANIMGGVGDNIFSPKGLFTREQSIITIIRLWDLLVVDK